MTDLEMVRLCAEAMGLHEVVNPDERAPKPKPPSILVSDSAGLELYEPLHDDAQAMALVKKFQLRIVWGGRRQGSESYVHVSSPQYLGSDDMPYYADNLNADLNRALCECVAKMQLCENPAHSPNGDAPS